MKSDKYSILLRTRKSGFSPLKLLQATKHTPQSIQQCYKNDKAPGSGGIDEGRANLLHANAMLP